MSLPDSLVQALAAFPAALQALVRAELAAGNRIVAIRSGFPAPPVGACLLLAQRVGTRARMTDGPLHFFERRHPEHSGEFTDAQGFFYVLEPPLPAPPDADMDALRAEREAHQRSTDAALSARASSAARTAQQPASGADTRQADPASPAPAPGLPSALVERFRESMAMDFERWHDGRGYAIELLAAATPAERAQIETLLLAHGVRDGHDAEALAMLDSPRAQQALRQAFASAEHRLRIELLLRAPGLFSDSERSAALLSALRSAGPFEGLTQALLLAEDWHPAPVQEALLRGVLERDGASAGAFAALLLFLHGQADSPCDMQLREVYRAAQDGDRSALFKHLCERIGVDAASQRRWLDASRT